MSGLLLLAVILVLALLAVSCQRAAAQASAPSSSKRTSPAPPPVERIYDGAALYWLYYSGANTPANSAFYGHLDLGWT